MSIVICPKCKSPNDDQSLAGGWLLCTICNNRWFPSAATIDSLPTAEIQQPRKVTVKPLPTPETGGLVTRSASGEYLPDEPETGALANRALTERVDGRQSGMQPVVGGSQRPTLENAPEVGHSSPGKSSPGAKNVGRAAAKRPVAHDPETGPTIDSDLFDRLEEDARYKRSEMKTVPEIVFDDPAKYRTAAPDSDHSEKISCPVCGHSYASSGTRHVCPQCGTAYDEESNRIAAGPETKDALIGRTLRGCLIDRKLGEGGMGAVYHAKQLSLDRSVAVKVLPVDLARNKNFIQRFEREAKSLARINHPNILQIYDFGDDPQLGLYFMIIEFVEGLDLGEVLNRRGLLDQVEVLDLLRQSVMGLEAAAEKSVIHRDIKPDNLMIGGNGLVKVSDFGLAKGYVAQVGVTAAGVRVGTPAFMSPEQCDGVEVDFRSDIYNLGATAFLCLTGRLPFDGETPFAIMLKHKTEAVPSLCAIDPTISPQVDRLISRMLAKKPAERCSTLRELIEDIETLETELAGTDSVLRKSRGPFKALLGAGREASPRPRHIPPAIPVVEQVELAELPPAPPALPAVASQSGGRAGIADGRSASRQGSSSGNLRRGIDVPVIPSTPLEVMPPLALASVGASSASSSGEQPGRRSSRRLDVELTQARERGRRSQLDLTIANGDRLAESGQLADAAREWLAAADLAATDPAQQKDLRRRAAAAKRRVGAARLVRRFLIAVACLILAVAAVWVATPPVHNWLAGQWLKVRIDGLATIPQARQKIAALNDFIASNNQPWEWYTSTFHRTYTIAAADAARAEIRAIESQPIVPVADPRQATTAGPEVAAVLTLAKDVSVAWETVAQRAGELLAAARAQGRDTAALDPLREVARQAETELTVQRADLERITQARSAGQQQQALDLAAAFRTRHVRAGAALVRLPLPARLRVTVSGLDVPGDLELRVDGAVVALTQVAPIDGEPTAEAVICRNGDRETAFELAADGFTAIHQTIPGSTSTGDRLLAVTLHPAPVWTLAYANPSATGTFVAWAQLHPLAGGLILQHRDGVLVLRPTDGAVGARIERQTPSSPIFGRLWQPVAGTKLMIAQDDGSVQLVAASTLIPEQAVHRGAGEVMAWADLDLQLQNGKRIHAAIERTVVAGKASVALVAQDANRQYWRYEKLNSANQLPQLISHDDRLYVFDDGALHLLEEDGTVVRVFAMPSPRIGMAVELPAPAANRRDLLVPTVNGTLRLQLGTHQDPVRMVADPVLVQAGAAQLAALGDTVLFASDKLCLLARFAPTGSVTWRQDQPRPLGALPVFSATHIVTADDQGTLLVRTRATGQVIQRVVHGTPLCGTPLLVDLPTGPGVVVCDRAGIAAAYRLHK